MRRALTWLPWILLVILGTMFWQKTRVEAPIAADGVQMPVEKEEPLVKPNAVDSYSNAVNVAAPAVVNIFTTQKLNGTDSALLKDPAFKKFFGNRLPEQKNQNENSLGSGVIVRTDGYILTNNHVIAQADKIIVGLRDGRRAKATVIGTDPDTDLAVIKIDLQDLPVLPFKPTGSQVGDVVLAIGNPFGVGQTVTQGIVSALGRSDLGINTYEDFIQTDAAINPGNSGGALIDVSGNLIGVNTAIFSQSGGSLGIGFAVPAKVCQQVFNSILKDGRVVRGWLGISLLPPSYNSDFDTVKPTDGIVVADIFSRGPAADAGLRKGDRILKVNNENMPSASHLINYVALQPPNSTVQIEIERNGEPFKVDVQVGERQQQNANAQYIPLPKR
ncbi:S1C family serine protease [Acinetobacter sp. HY1485]|uniref:S1C family serine protease n=1 Tax=Acinetobacter sp. HY1485 TaxID=2970918 RepID=UPI0022B9ADEB|nr:trypsin-like peptidase domain-containing protein [Acinetobacter sp. HY1485]